MIKRVDAIVDGQLIKVVPASDYDKLEAVLRKYGGHLTECNRLGVLNGDCYCGWAHTMDLICEKDHI